MFPNQSLSKTDGVLPHLTTQLRHNQLALGSQVLFAIFDNACTLFSCFCLHLGFTLLALFLGGFADFGGFDAGVGKLFVVLFEHSLGFILSFFGVFNATLNELFSLGKCFQETWEHQFPEQKSNN